MRVERVVIDSNVLIAALVSPAGTARRVIETVLAREIDVLLSEAVFAELVSRLERPKFDRYREAEAWEQFLSGLVELAIWHEDTGVAAGVCRDPDDDKFLALAVAGGADVVISGDRNLLDPGSYEGIRMVTPASFLEMLGDPCRAAWRPTLRNPDRDHRDCFHFRP